MRTVLLVVCFLAAGCASQATSSGPGGTGTTPSGGGGATALDGSVCSGGSFTLGGAQLSEAQAAMRRGVGARTFADVVTTIEKPIEVCGVREQLAWLTTVTCTDGSNPFADERQAHGARLGNVGPGGLCGHIIDVYAVGCPEARYEVHMDLYMCPPGGSPFD